MLCVACFSVRVISLIIVGSLCVVCFLFCFFLFQAEDGIRDLVRSRGLGDVYKRQLMACLVIRGMPLRRRARARAPWGRRASARAIPGPVSYTHLTLPTSDLVEISVVAGSLKKKKVV